MLTFIFVWSLRSNKDKTRAKLTKRTIDEEWEGITVKLIRYFWLVASTWHWNHFLPFRQSSYSYWIIRTRAPRVFYWSTLTWWRVATAMRIRRGSSNYSWHCRRRSRLGLELCDRGHMLCGYNTKAFKSNQIISKCGNSWIADLSGTYAIALLFFWTNVSDFLIS